MVVGAVPEAADLVVVGAGPGGYTAALHALRYGRRVMLVDRAGRDGVGGACLRTGCIPSKALIETAQLFAQATAGAERGVVCPAPRVDLAAFQSFKQRLVARLAGGVARLLEAGGVDVVAGEASLIDETTLIINQPGGGARFVEFRDLVIATGSSPATLPGLPVDGERVLDSSAVLDLDAVPASLCIVGAGYIGIELGMAFAKLGTRVTVVEMAERILPDLPPELGIPVAGRMSELGMKVLLEARVSALRAGKMEIVGRDGALRFEPDLVMVAAGRRPALDALNLASIGVEPGPGGRLEVRPDRRLRPHIAALGDLTPGPALAHKASAEALVAVEALCDENTAFAPAAVPMVVFSDPELASVGLGSGTGRKTARFPVAASGRAGTLSEDLGFVEVVSSEQDDTLLGVHIAAPHASELIAEGALAIEMGATLEDLALTIHSHPTLSEMIGEAAGLGLGRPLHLLKSAPG